LAYVGVEEQAFELCFGLLHFPFCLSPWLLLEVFGVVLLVGVSEAFEHLHVAFVGNVEKVGRGYDFPKVQTVFLRCIKFT
jgi:hypothetical protein